MHASPLIVQVNKETGWDLAVRQGNVMVHELLADHARRGFMSLKIEFDSKFAAGCNVYSTANVPAAPSYDEMAGDSQLNSGLHFYVACVAEILYDAILANHLPAVMRAIAAHPSLLGHIYDSRNGRVGIYSSKGHRFTNWLERQCSTKAQAACPG